jgi:hypothetical protein
MAGAAVLSNFARRLQIAWQPLEAALIEINGSLSVEPQFSPPQPEIRVTLRDQGFLGDAHNYAIAAHDVHPHCTGVLGVHVRRCRGFSARGPVYPNVRGQ